MDMRAISDAYQLPYAFLRLLLVARASKVTCKSRPAVGTSRLSTGKEMVSIYVCCSSPPVRNMLMAPFEYSPWYPWLTHLYFR
jgi:hypothetical protein